MTADELAVLLGVDRKTVYEGAARGEIPSVRLGRRVLFSKTAIEGWLAAVGQGPATTAAPVTVRRSRGLVFARLPTLPRSS